jgi:hypothetical protein
VAIHGREAGDEAKHILPAPRVGRHREARTQKAVSFGGRPNGWGPIFLVNSWAVSVPLTLAPPFLRQALVSVHLHGKPAHQWRFRRHHTLQSVYQEYTGQEGVDGARSLWPCAASRLAIPRNGNAMVPRGAQRGSRAIRALTKAACRCRGRADIRND